MTRTLNIGDPAPEFDMPTDGGGRVTLRALLGTRVVLYFYPKDDTPGCTSQAKAFTDAEHTFAALGARVIGVSPDPVEKHDKFKAKHALEVTLASDDDHAVAERYGVWVEKNMYGKRFMGIQRATFVIDAAGRIQAMWPKVKVSGHVDDVIEALKAQPSADPADPA